MSEECKRTASWRKDLSSYRQGMNPPHNVRCRRARVRQFTNPWQCYQRSAPSEPLADLFGRPLELSAYRRGGRRVTVWQDVSSTTTPSRPEQSRLRALLRRKAAVMATYRNHEECTAIEISTIEALWYDGLSLRSLARRDGVSAAAIETRLHSISKKAPEFFRWWRLKQQHRGLR